MTCPIDLDETYGCWLWQGRLDAAGYGRGKRRRAHIEVYEAERGAVPSGMELDHVCRRRNCVNPAHLEPVSGSTNGLRKRWGVRVAVKACPIGHELVDPMVTPEGGRVCRVCARNA